MPSPGTSPDSYPRRFLGLAAFVVGVAAYVWAVGWVFEVVQFTAARLPALQTVEEQSPREVFSQGLLSTLLMVAAAAVLGALAYFSSARNWDVYGPEWHAIVTHGVSGAAADPDLKEDRERRKRRHKVLAAQRRRRWTRRLPGKLKFIRRRPTKEEVDGERQGEPVSAETRGREEVAPLGDWAVRLVAGFNMLVLSLLIALGLARLVGVLFPLRPWASLAPWLGLIVGAVAFLIVRRLLTKFSPLLFPARIHGLTWAMLALAAFFASAPVGVIVLSGVAISTFGRRLARWPKPRGLAQLIRSPLPWVLLAFTTLLGVAYSAMPPVPFPQVFLSTRAGALIGGYVSRQGDGLYVVTCTGLADATSIDERLTFVPGSDLRTTDIQGGSFYLDSGDRPSLAKLAMDALGLGVNPPTLFSAALRAKHPTCAGARPGRPALGVPAPELGPGVIAGPTHSGLPANDGEPPIQRDGRTPTKVAKLAQKYQPTLLVTAADRNWPVSVNAVLAERGPRGQPVCLIQRGGARKCRPTASDLRPAGATQSDYLQLPVKLGGNRSPNGQFQAFLRGQYQRSGPLKQWLADPTRLDPWRSAEIYFYYAGAIKTSQWPKKAVNPNVSSGLIGLEYWFYYPFNYYPAIVDSDLMDLAPIAGDLANLDLHQGDWEHVDVLLNPADDKPAWLYMARHADEGTFIPWSSPTLHFDGSHPVIQAAFGGHPSYVPGCGPGSRTATLNASADWLACGSGRFAFRATSTPLVNIQNTPWRCWPGYFGEATKLEVNNEHLFEKALQVLYTAGPRGPLIQAENTDTCNKGRLRSAYPRRLGNTG
jgi:hypothetical protein